MLQQEKPDDWVVSTQSTHSVRELCEFSFGFLGLDYKKYVVQNPKYMRPNELKYLKGDSSVIRKELGWKPEYDFKSLVEEMTTFWMGVKERQIKLDELKKSDAPVL